MSRWQSATCPTARHSWCTPTAQLLGEEVDVGPARAHDLCVEATILVAGMALTAKLGAHP